MKRRIPTVNKFGQGEVGIYSYINKLFCVNSSIRLGASRFNKLLENILCFLLLVEADIC